MSEELKLKPCPLCGGKADFWGGAGAVLAGCSKCNIHTIYCYPPEDAARVWNSRPAEDAKIARIAELEAERAQLRKALEAIAKFADREYEKRIPAPSCVEFLTIKLCAKNTLKGAVAKNATVEPR